MRDQQKLPVCDLHCDLLSYLVRVPDASLSDVKYIGASVPHLKKGNVKLQLLAIFETTQRESSRSGLLQARKFQQLLSLDEFRLIDKREDLTKLPLNEQIGIMVAIENASTFCEEDESLKLGFRRLEHIIETAGRPVYLMLTHHHENRFGGGNYSPNVGLKDDGRALIDYLDGRRIALDLSHASDALAEQAINYIDKHSIDIPIIASHSNFRSVWDHVRNLPLEIAEEIIQRKGLIGINFLRAYLHSKLPDTLYTHISYGLDIGGENALAFGADFFYTKAIRDPARHPLFFKEFSNAASYQPILKVLGKQLQQPKLLQKIAYQNVLSYLERSWMEK